MPVLPRVAAGKPPMMTLGIMAPVRVEPQPQPWVCVAAGMFSMITLETPVTIAVCPHMGHATESPIRAAGLPDMINVLINRGNVGILASTARAVYARLVDLCCASQKHRAVMACTVPGAMPQIA
ncbi:hypothetical protein PSEUDO8Z_100324 [Pseudomonas sp. 8Z]|nr:hypothetical protein PSEUDO8Z_100324 [Pseudomonas sp. 8Z]